MLFFNKGGITMAKKRTHEEFLKIVADFDVLDEFEVTGKYVNNSTKIKIFHKKCNEGSKSRFLLSFPAIRNKAPEWK